MLYDVHSEISNHHLGIGLQAHLGGELLLKGGHLLLGVYVGKNSDALYPKNPTNQRGKEKTLTNEDPLGEPRLLYLLLG